MIRRDQHSKALIETDTTELSRYRKEKLRDKEFEQMKQEISSLKVRINRLCDTLKKIEAKV